MDVTSLLNGPSVAVDQSKEGDQWPIPPRNRTPWDAGGYSLPVNSHHRPQDSVTTTSTVTTTVRKTSHHNEAQQSPEPTSSSHRLSDSRSSLSSFASASTSNNHSRYSSTSTVSGFHLSSSIIDLQKSSEEDQTQHAPPGLSTNPARVLSDSSPKSSLSTLAFVAGNRLQLQIPSDSSRDLPQCSAMRTRSMSEMESPCQDEPEPSRSGSPSDAILFKRPAPSGQPRSPDGETDSVQTGRGSSHFGPTIDTPNSASTRELTSSLRHKRAISAPNFASASGADGRARSKEKAFMGPSEEPTPPSSHHPDRLSPEASWNAPETAPDTPPEAEVDSAEQPILCMYIANCNTNSQPRKAISHIFGRNKMCTRLIPQSVWVHFCRKHYQRSRYRNQKEYAKLQCKLIKEQIWRLDRWSKSNERSGEGGFVKDWGISIRKREQKRLDDLAENDENKNVGDQRGSEDLEDSGRADPVPVTAVPEWLLSLCGRGYDKERIEDIFDRLHTEIESDIIPVFPDIEILPNIVVDREEPKSPKGYAKRKPVLTAHKRSQSLGGAALRNDRQPPRRMSQPIVWNPSEMYGSEAFLQQKRKRSIEDLDEDHFARSPSSQRQRRVSTASEMTMRHPSHLLHRPAFEHIQEQYQEDQQYPPEGRGYDIHRIPPPRPHYRSASVSARQIPLPAPVPQRRASQSTAAQLDHRLNTPSNAPRYSYGTPQEPRRPVHNRSQSDMGAIQHGHGHGHYPFASTTYFPPPPAHQVLPSQGRPIAHAHPSSDITPRDSHGRPQSVYAPQAQHYVASSSALAAPPQALSGHNRHLSTPANLSRYIPSQSPAHQQHHDTHSQPQEHGRNVQYHGHPARIEEQQQVRTYHIEESQQARSMYAARR